MADDFHKIMFTNAVVQEQTENLSSFVYFSRRLFLSDHNVAPPNTSSAYCIMTAFGGPCGLL